MAEESCGLLVELLFTGGTSGSREVTSSLWELGLLFGQEASQGDDVGVDLFGLAHAA